MEQFHGTTIVSVRRGSQVALGGDGQVTLGNVVMKGSARKVRKLYQGKVLCGFAGATADAFTLLDRFEAKLEKHQGNLLRSSVELAKDWRTDRMLSKLEAMLLVADREVTLDRTVCCQDAVRAAQAGRTASRTDDRNLAFDTLDHGQVARKAQPCAPHVDAVGERYRPHA